MKGNMRMVFETAATVANIARKTGSSLARASSERANISPGTIQLTNVRSGRKKTRARELPKTLKRMCAQAACLAVVEVPIDAR